MRRAPRKPSSGEPYAGPREQSTASREQSAASRKKPTAPREKSAPPPLTPNRLGDQLLRYLNQRDASRARAKTYLERWILKHYGPAQVQSEQANIQALLARFEASGLLDERRLATHLVESFRRRGASQRAISQKLRARGLEASHIQEAFEQEQTARSVDAERDEEQGGQHAGTQGAEPDGVTGFGTARRRVRGSSAELEAARAFVKKRRIGPYRPENERAENRRKDLAKLARAGFDFDTACSALGGSFSDDDF